MKTRTRQIQLGFSLIEIMVVLLVIGIGISFVTLSMSAGDPQKQLRQQSDQFADRARLAMDDAVFSGEAMAFYILPPPLDGAWQYGWLRFRDDQWQPQEQPLGRVHLSEGVRLELSVDGQWLDWGSKQFQQPTPMAVFYPSGDISDFILRFLPADVAADESLGRQLRLNQYIQLVLEPIEE